MKSPDPADRSGRNTPERLPTPTGCWSVKAPELFSDLSPAALRAITTDARHLSFAAGQYLCREGDVGSSVLVLERGAAEVLVGAGTRRVGRLRRGDVIGELSILSGQPRSATVRAIVDTDVVMIGPETLLRALAEHPQLVLNLSRILGRRLARAHLEQLPSGSGEAVGLILGPTALQALQAILTAASQATPQRVTSLGLLAGLPASAFAATTEAATLALDDLLAAHGFVLVIATPDTEGLAALVAQLDRTVVVGTAAETTAVAEQLGSGSGLEAVDLDRQSVPWLGRHLTRTKLGLALGAGGAKGFAHLGVLAVLEDAGYTVDAVSGSSLGSLIAACVAMGTGSAEIESLLRERFSPEMVRAVFSLAFSGASPGYPAMEALLREVAGGRDVSDLVIPFVALAVDLNSRRPVALTSGSLAEALLASTALPGLFPPFERAGQRLVDGLALVPVPVSAVQDCGADVTVAVNLMSIDTLPAWPGESSPPPVAGKQRMLETLLEVMELTQTDASTRHAALADVVITPSFGPCTWRDFHLAERFTAAGREAALGSLDQLRALATPMQPGRQVGTPGPC